MANYFDNWNLRPLFLDFFKNTCKLGPNYPIVFIRPPNNLPLVTFSKKHLSKIIYHIRFGGCTIYLYNKNFPIFFFGFIPIYHPNSLFPVLIFPVLCFWIFAYLHSIYTSVKFILSISYRYLFSTLFDTLSRFKWNWISKNDKSKMK